MILQQFNQKDDKAFYYISENHVLFKIRKMESNYNILYVFFDYTYKKTKFYSFDSFKEAKDLIDKRFDNYIKKYGKGNNHE